MELFGFELIYHPGDLDLATIFARLRHTLLGFNACKSGSWAGVWSDLDSGCFFFNLSELRGVILKNNQTLAILLNDSTVLVDRLSPSTNQVGSRC